ncbi:MAG: small ribosomal subunit Rsm22 family protein, partial [Chlamydiota bacterium]
MMHSQLGKILEGLQEEFFSSKKRADFAKAFERISARYRAESGLFLQTEEERKAYLFTRLPGTFSAISKVLEEMIVRCPSLSIWSFLDVGAGPGTGLWAASELFSDLTKCTLLEKDRLFMDLGKELAKRASSSSIQKATWKSCDVEKTFEVEPHDLVLLSYSIGELKEASWLPLLSTLWNATNKVIVIVEPGTPSGYAKLMKIREILKNFGGHIWAPCPHVLACPLLKGDWCHFSVRVARSSMHRHLKSADLGYEDEKFSYLIFGKEPISSFQARVIRRPAKHPGHLELITCQESGLKKEVYSKKDKETYKRRKKL